MRVLVCDDDKPTRFVIRRLLTQRLACDVTECGDGLEVLERLGAGADVDLLILDINMPTLDGVDVLESIRRTPRFAHLPVIMLSHERRQEIVVKLIHLGIFGYLTKPPTADALIALVDKVRNATITDSQVPDIRLDAGTPALVVDGDAEYRRFFVAQAEAYGTITSAEFGLSALATFKRAPSSLVFVGGDLGVIGRHLLVRKLREMLPDRPLRIVEVREANDQSILTPGADDVMPRTLTLADHRAALRAFVRVTGPIDGVSAAIGDPGALLTSASAYVVKTMLDMDVQPAVTSPPDVDVCATLHATVRHQYNVRIDWYQSKRDASQMTASLRSIASRAVTDEDINAASTEMLTALRARLQAAVTARQVEFECSLPRIRYQQSMVVQAPQDGYGLQLPFTTSTGVSFMLLVSVTKGSDLAHDRDARLAVRNT